MEKYTFFSDEEIECKCGCGTMFIAPLHFFRMNLLRSYLKRPIEVTSWCRCEEHNLEVGGKPDSSHLKFIATDIKAILPLYRSKILYFAGLIGFNGVGIGKTFIHLDSDLSKGLHRFWRY